MKLLLLAPPANHPFLHHLSQALIIGGLLCALILTAILTSKAQAYWKQLGTVLLALPMILGLFILLFLHPSWSLH